VELAVVAAAQRGHTVTVTPFPQGVPDPHRLPAGSVVATLTLGPAGSAPGEPLYASTGRRHTAKTAYAEGQPLPETLVAAWVDTAR